MNNHIDRRSGFTLIELLIVIGIVAMLIGILVPALARARETSRRVACLSNLRQMVTAAQNYADKYDGCYPIAYYAAFNGPTTYSYCWDLTTVSTPGQPVKVIPGLLWDGLGAERIQQCPSFEGAANWASNPFTGYNYNTSYIGHGQYEAIPGPIRASKVHHASSVAMFGDGQYSAGANKFMRAPWPNPGDATFSGRWAGTQGFRHQGYTNVAFCDGHAASLNDCVTDNKDGSGKVAKGTGFLSADNSMYDPQ